MNLPLLLLLALAPGDGPLSTRAPVVEASCSLPAAVTSFGAALVGPWVYVYGGHAGAPHDYCREDVSGSFRRARVDDFAHWEALPSGEPAQGTALVAFGEQLYRIGGMAAENARGEPERLRSSATVARFDPAGGRWIAARALP